LAPVTPAKSPQPAQSAFPPGGQSAFSDDSLSKGDMDSLFTEMPDWLAGVASEQAGPTGIPGDSNVIAPGSLPSWVEAMRPVESSIARSDVVGDQELETRGPLAGLQGVLPAVPFLGPSSKPKAYSIKLTASEEQQAHAGLLEEVLAAETIPVPITSQKQVASQRLLRLMIAVLLIVALAIPVIAGTQIFGLPANTEFQDETIQSALEAGVRSIHGMAVDAVRTF
jgi:hypothetical protein